MSADLRLPGLGELADAEPITDFKLRPYRAEAVAGVFKSWEQFDRVPGIAPTMHWYLRELSDKQVEFLCRYRVDPSVVRNREHASAIIDTIRRYNESVPATPKQLSHLRFLRYRGDTSSLSKPAAARLIGQIKGNGEEEVPNGR